MIIHSTGIMANANISEPFDNLILFEPKLKTSHSKSTVVKLTTIRHKYLNKVEDENEVSSETPVVAITTNPNVYETMALIPKSMSGIINLRYQLPRKNTSEYNSKISIPIKESK